MAPYRTECPQKALRTAGSVVTCFFVNGHKGGRHHHEFESRSGSVGEGREPSFLEKAQRRSVTTLLDSPLPRVSILLRV
jgi:hypothetical protein